MADVTEEQATKRLNEYTGMYRNLAIAQYNLALQEGQSIDEALDTVAKKIIETATAVIDRK